MLQPSLWNVFHFWKKNITQISLKVWFLMKRKQQFLSLFQSKIFFLQTNEREKRTKASRNRDDGRETKEYYCALNLTFLLSCGKIAKKIKEKKTWGNIWKWFKNCDTRTCFLSFIPQWKSFINQTVQWNENKMDDVNLSNFKSGFVICIQARDWECWVRVFSMIKKINLITGFADVSLGIANFAGNFSLEL